MSFIGGGGGSAGLTDLLIPLVVSLGEMGPALSGIESKMSNSATTLMNSTTRLVGNYNSPAGLAGQGLNANQAIGRATVDFSGLGAQSFYQATLVQTKISQAFSDAFKALGKATNTFLGDINNTDNQYDGQLQAIQPQNYFAQGQAGIGNAANQAFLALDPYTAMVTDVLMEVSTPADVSSILQSGPSVLTEHLASAYQKLLGEAQYASIHLPAPLPGAGSSSAPSPNVGMARSLVEQSLAEMYQAINQVYTGWGDAIQQAFSTFKSSVTTAQQRLQPVIDLINHPNNAASIFELISLISGSTSPIAITQIGPNRILVSISGLQTNHMSYDTSLWEALGIGMGQTDWQGNQKMPYLQDVITAIQQFIAERGLVNPQVVLAGHSLGGMIAEDVAGLRMFNVTQVVTYGSPILMNPVPGVKYDIYEAQGDLVPMLSHYENPLLPSSLQQVQSMFPGYFPPAGSSIWSHIVAYTKDVGVVGEAPVTYGVGGARVLGAVGSIVRAEYGPADFLNGPSQVALGSVKKLAYMDPHGLYGGSLQAVPDLTTLNPGVHSHYNWSPWLEQQKIYQNMPGSGFLTSTEYFGMPNMPEMAQINQYMGTNSSLGWLLAHHFHK